jgi:hypothetical protein
VGVVWHVGVWARARRHVAVWAGPAAVWGGVWRARGGGGPAWAGGRWRGDSARSSARRGRVLRHAPGAVHLPGSAGVLRVPQRHPGLHGPALRRLEPRPGQVLRRLAGGWQPPLPHRHPSAGLRRRQARRANRLPVPQPDGPPGPALPAPRLLLPRYELRSSSSPVPAESPRPRLAPGTLTQRNEEEGCWGFRL